MTTAYPLQWPEGWPRTPVDERDEGYRFKQSRDVQRTRNVPNGQGGWKSETFWDKERGSVTFAKSRDKLYAELERLGAESVVISTNHKPDIRGVPIESKRGVEDDGVAIYFQYLGKPMAMACDRFENAAANMRSLGLAIDAMRQLERHGGGIMMERAFAGFTALPAPGATHWSSILQVARTASRADIEAAYRKLARERHPDSGGNDAMMADLNTARDRALKEARP